MARAPEIHELLSEAAQVMTTSRRSNTEKRIVQLAGIEYVLYRFPNAVMLNMFERVLNKAAEAGVEVQSIVSRTSARAEYREMGYWLALSCLQGDESPGTATTLKTMASLGRNLARLHSINGHRWGPLFQKESLLIPHDSFQKNKTLPEKNRIWVSNSHARMQAMRSFQLVHGELVRKHILLREDESVALIGYEMLAYEPAGIKLATALLRPFCKDEKNRRMFFNTYMDSCTDEVRKRWKACANDFLFTAPARLAHSRARKVLSLQKKIRLLDEQLLSRGTPSTQHELDEKKLENLASLERAERMLGRWRHMAHSVIDLNLGQPGIEPMDLITQSYKLHDARQQVQRQSAPEEQVAVLA